MKLLHLTAFLVALGAAACATADPEPSMSVVQPETTGQSAPPPAPAQPAPTPAPQTAEPSASPGPAAQPAAWTDAQLRSFIVANREITTIMQAHQAELQGPPEQQEAARSAVMAAATPVLARNNLDAETYNAIAAQLRTDTALQARTAQLNAQMQTPAPATPQR